MEVSKNYVIQANYLWSQNIDAIDFVNAGFIKDLVPPVNGCDEITSNVVLTYKKRK